MAFIFAHSPEIAGAVALALLFFILVSRHFHQPIVKGQQRIMTAHSLNKSGYVEAIRGIEAIKSANAESVFTRLMRDTYTHLQEEIFRLGRVAVRFGSGAGDCRRHDCHRRTCVGVDTWCSATPWAWERWSPSCK